MKVNYRVATLQPGTDNVVSSVNVGQEFDLALYTQDLRDPNIVPILGVFAAYVDVLYDKTLSHVRTYETQTLTFSPNLPLVSNMYVIFGVGLVGPVPYNNTNALTRATTAKNIQNAMNAKFGANKFSVSATTKNLVYNVKFAGYPDVDEPLLRTSPIQIAVRELIKGNSEAAFFPSFQFSANYPNGKSAQYDLYRIQALGAFTNTFSGLGPYELEVVRVRMVAKAAGNANFTIDLSNINHPMDDTLVFGENDAVDISDISTTPTTLVIQ